MSDKKHDDNVVLEARRLRALGWPYKLISKELNVSVHTIQDWCLNRRRKNEIFGRISE